MSRPDSRRPDQLRPLTFRRRYTRSAPGSVLVKAGRTTVLCACCVEPAVPEFLVGKGKGWLTAEYGMLPGSTATRKPRDRAGKIDGRGVEIQRLIGRSLRAVVDLAKLGERTLWIDCDVIEADGGTRTAAINGAFVAVVDGLSSIQGVLGVPVREVVFASLAAVSVGVVDGEERLDLEYVEGQPRLVLADVRRERRQLRRRHVWRVAHHDVEGAADRRAEQVALPEGDAVRDAVRLGVPLRHVEGVGRNIHSGDAGVLLLLVG